jgi:predicted phosphodiesterase
MRVAAVLVLGGLAIVSSAGCGYEPNDTADSTDTLTGAGDTADDQALWAIEPTVTTLSAREPMSSLLVDPSAPPPWSFAVLSDLHLPNPRAAMIDQTIQALIAMHVRLVIVTGDHTNGSEKVDHRRGRVKGWWTAVTDAFEPLHDAGIAVLPIAGNHDTYLSWQREGYEQAFADLGRWAAPFRLNPGTGSGVARVPYSYSLDVDGVHFALAHVVDQTIDREVAGWLTGDLAAAANARLRFVFGHVPLFSVIRRPARQFVDRFGPILEHGHADFYVAGHEHVTWDETFTLRSGDPLRQVTVGCASGFYVFPPSRAAQRHAACERHGASGPLSCTMPNGGRFELVRDRSRHMVEHDVNTFTVFTVTGDDVQVTPMTVDADGQPHPFYLSASRATQDREPAGAGSAG